MAKLAARTNREFVVALHHSRTGITEDMLDICGTHTRPRA